MWWCEMVTVNQKDEATAKQRHGLGSRLISSLNG